MYNCLQGFFELTMGHKIVMWTSCQMQQQGRQAHARGWVTVQVESSKSMLTSCSELMAMISNPPEHSAARVNICETSSIRLAILDSSTRSTCIGTRDFATGFVVRQTPFDQDYIPWHSTQMISDMLHCQSCMGDYGILLHHMPSSNLSVDSRQ